MVTICCTITPGVQSDTECKVDSIWLYLRYNPRYILLRLEPLYFMTDAVQAFVDCESNIVVRVLLREGFGKWNYIFLDAAELKCLGGPQ